MTILDFILNNPVMYILTVVNTILALILVIKLIIFFEDKLKEYEALQEGYDVLMRKKVFGENS